MASATATTRPERPPRRLFASATTRIIFLANFLGFAVLAAGAMFFSVIRDDLTRSQLTALELQGRVISNLVVRAAAVEPEVPAAPPRLDPDRAGQALLELVPQTQALTGATYSGPRIAIISRDGELIADTITLHGALDERQAEGQKPPARSVLANVLAAAGEVWRSVLSLRLTPWRPDFTVQEEIAAALEGAPQSGQRLNARGERVISVSLPLQQVGFVMGVVTLESADVEMILAREREALLPYVLAAALITALSSIAMALAIARPLRRLSKAADAVRLSGAARMELPDMRTRKDEIGDLAHALEAMTGALADRIDANERFAADVAHELKNPLTSIRSAVETLNRVADGETRAELLRVITTDVGRLDRLITDMTRASRLEAETARGALETVDLTRLLSDMADTYGLLSDGRAEVRYVGEAASAPVMGQPGPLGQVFLNLVDNARSFAPVEGGEVRLDVALTRQEGRAIARATVEDNGPGIPPENLETIFKRFYTDRPARAAFGGNSGLGLSIARQIVEAHEGRIFAQNLTSEDGRISGARFVVELPCAPHTRTER